MIPARSSRATTTTGTTTAIAVLPPVLSPFWVVPSAGWGEEVFALDGPRELALVAMPPAPDAAEEASRVITEVTMIGVGVSPGRVVEGTTVTSEIRTSVEGAADGAVDT